MCIDIEYCLAIYPPAEARRRVPVRFLQGNLIRQRNSTIGEEATESDLETASRELKHSLATSGPTHIDVSRIDIRSSINRH